MTVSTTAVRGPRRDFRCYYRPALLVAIAAAILGVFWLTSRYPQLLAKKAHLGAGVASMAFGDAVFEIAPTAPAWEKVGYSALNWLAGMRAGMTFGVLFGALLHTVLRYYPIKIGSNLYLNSLKGALVGMPAGVCANCSVPAACGVTRGHGRVEVALGFLFSSPNFNPVVVAMTFAALPWQMGLAKYAVLLFVILWAVPALVGWLERDRPLPTFGAAGDAESCSINVPAGCTDSPWAVGLEIAKEFLKNVWMLLKPTLVIMALASVAAGLLLTFVPWDSLLAEVTFGKALALSFLSTLMPVPIALDVMFAQQLHVHGVAPGYVMLFAMTLGAYSVVPTVYLWREVSKTLSVSLFLFFVAVGVVMAFAF